MHESCPNCEAKEIVEKTTDATAERFGLKEKYIVYYIECTKCNECFSDFRTEDSEMNAVHKLLYRKIQILEWELNKNNQ